MISNRLHVLILLALAAFILHGCPAKTQRRHILVLSSVPAFEPIFHGLKSQLEQLGYVEGVHVTYALKYFNPSPAALQALEKELAAERQADLIFAFPTEAAIAAIQTRASTNVPVVFGYAGIEGIPLVASVREPGGQITGVRYPGPEQIGKRLELIRMVAPHIQRVWIGYQKDYPNSSPVLTILHPLAKSLNLELVDVPVNTFEELKADLDRRDRFDDPGMDAMILMPDALNHSPDGWRLINAFAVKHNLPLGGSFLYTVEQGAVFGNANDLAEIGKLAAPLVDKIFKGIPAGTIPVVSPEQDLYINYQRARELELELPEGLLRQAKVIIR